MPPLKNLRHEKFARKLVSGSTQSRAYHEVYQPKSITTSESNSTGLIQRPDVRERCLELMDKKKGLRLDDQLNNLLDLTTADKDIVIDGKVIKDAIKDNPTRTEALKVSLKLRGLLQGNTRGMTTVDARSVQFNLGNDAIPQLSIIISRLDAMGNKDEDAIEGELNKEIRDSNLSTPSSTPSSSPSDNDNTNGETEKTETGIGEGGRSKDK